MRLLLTFLCLIPLCAQQETAKKNDQAAQEQAVSKAADQKAAEQKPDAKKADDKAGAQAAPEKAAAEQPAPSLSLTGSVDVGYRWVTDVAGNSNVYRSIVNLGEGPKLLGVDLSLENASHRLFDKATLQGMGWGGDPYTTARLNVVKQHDYNLTVDYRNLVYFNSLPSFANPSLDRGILFSERSYDLHRRRLDAELDLRPTSRIIPYLAFARDWGSGRGVVPFVNGSANEYPVLNQPRDMTDTYRAGVRVELNHFHVTLEGGGSTFKDDQTISTSTQNFGDRTTPQFGRTLFINSLQQSYGVRGTSLFGKTALTWSPASWIDIYGQAVYSRPRTTTHFTQSVAGNLFNQDAFLFYATGYDALSAEAKQPHTSANFGGELRPFRRLRIVESWMTDRFHTASAGTLAQLTGTLATNLNLGDRLTYNYNRQEVDVYYDITSKLTLRGGYRYVWGDAEVRAPILSGASLERGELRQQVGLAGAQYRPAQKLTIYLDYEGASAGASYFRTSLHDYQKGKLRARYQFSEAWSFAANASILDNQNPSPTIRYDFRSAQTSASVFWTPKGGKRVSVLGDYTRSTLRSDINYFIPNTLSPDRSFYRDNGHIGTVLVDLTPFNRTLAPHFSLGGSVFASSGTQPSRYYQPLAKITFKLHERLLWQTEWRWYSLSENSFLFEGFRTHLFVSSLRITR